MSEVWAFDDADFPGYDAAVAHENLVRAAACLGKNETICGLEVKSLDAHHVRLLTLINSPFLATVTAEELCTREEAQEWLLHHIMLFLWTVSPMFELGSMASEPPQRKWWQKFITHHASRITPPTARDRFNTAFAPILQQPLDVICREILEYIAEAYQDAEPGDGTGNNKSYYAFEIMIAEELHANYPRTFRLDFWSADCPPSQNPLHVPLKLVFQLRKCRHHRKGEGVSNKSDTIIAAGLAALGRKHQRQRDYETELSLTAVAPGTHRFSEFDYGQN